MAITKAEIKECFESHNNGQYSHMIMVCDTFSYEDYPVYVRNNEKIHEKVLEIDNKNMQQVMEVYNYKMDICSQINDTRYVKNF
jgi:gamma-glutamylcyclotransferase (GGCT)/AIG2-like uncharacterized protein YtfP